MKTILVTGGCGFIGTNFVRYLLKETDYKVIVLDKITYCGNLNNLKGLEEYKNRINKEKNRFELVIGSINDVTTLIKQADYVVNFAAESHVDNSIKNPSVFIKTNVLGTLNLLNQCRNYGVERYLQVSTDEVYGSLDWNEKAFTEESVIKPNSPYSASKASADLLVHAFHKTYGLSTIITRCSNNYGPYQYPEKLIPLCIDYIINGKKISVYGTGENVRDWIHVYDHCTGILTALEKGRDGEVYNIGAENELSNIAIISKIIYRLAYRIDIQPFIEHVTDRLGHDKRYAIDSSKIKKLGWKPITNFEEGLNRTIDWYLDSAEWLKDLEERKLCGY